MNLRIVRPGMLTTVQDLGRPGLQRYGVSVGGAMDALSLRVANSLVGNDESDAALEITVFLQPRLQCRLMPRQFESCRDLRLAQVAVPGAPREQNGFGFGNGHLDRTSLAAPVWLRR